MRLVYCACVVVCVSCDDARYVRVCACVKVCRRAMCDVRAGVRSIFDRETGSKPERLRSGFLQADLSLIV